MVYFQTNNPYLGKIWKAFGMKTVVSFYDHLEYFSDIWYKL
jgi:hypothetical protein